MPGLSPTCTRPVRLPALALAVCLLAPAIHAAEIQSIEVSKERGRYFVTSRSLVDAPREAVFEFLTDYDNFHKISSIFVESRMLEPDPVGYGGLVYTRSRGCVAFLCTTIERVERLNAVPFSEVTASLVPERSEGASYGEARWTLTERNGGTLIDYELEMQPDIWIPPIIGTWVVKRTLRQGANDAIVRLEQTAREIAARSAR